MTTNEKLQQLFDAALQSLDEPVAKTAPVVPPEKKFIPPPRPVPGDAQPQPLIFPPKKTQA